MFLPEPEYKQKADAMGSDDAQGGDDVAVVANAPNTVPKVEPTLAERSGPAIADLVKQIADANKRTENRSKALLERAAEELKSLERRNIDLQSLLQHHQQRAEAAEQWLLRIQEQVQGTLFAMSGEHPAAREAREAARTDDQQHTAMARRRDFTR